MMRTIITLTTDFGTGSPYVGQMKGVILSINPEANILDITHDVPPQDIRQGALVLETVTPQFPAESIHVAVVDPGVGTDREIIYAKIGPHHFIAPDNGLLDRLAEQQSPCRILTLSNPKYRLTNVSSTFHGRDIMAPAAAHLSLGMDAAELGKARLALARLEWPEVEIVPQKLSGEIQSIDSFGNLVTNITAEMLADVPRDDTVVVRCDDHETTGIFSTYGDQPEMTLIAIIGSSGQLELAIVDDSAKIMLGVAVGTPVEVTW